MSYTSAKSYSIHHLILHADISLSDSKEMLSLAPLFYSVYFICVMQLNYYKYCLYLHLPILKHLFRH